MTPVPTVGHVMIRASAGTGKTHALTNRYIRLLALGEAPDRIVALTFTRKAAGEFFDKILGRLAAGASDPAEARRLASDIGVPEAGQREFLALLRSLAGSIHRLRLGTIDSFFSAIARNFGVELGLAGDFELLEGHAARLERARVLRRLFERGAAPSRPQLEFIEAFKQATFGTSEKRLGASLDRFISQHHELFLSAPAAESWGNPVRIWRAGCEWLSEKSDLLASAREVRAVVEGLPLSDGQRARWGRFFAELEEWTPETPPGKGLQYLLSKALEAGPDAPEILIDRKRHPLPAAARAPLRRIVRQVCGAELERRLAMTRGIHAVLTGYDAAYHDAVRRAGRLTFGDVQRVLLPSAGGGRMLSREEGEGRLFIDYRLDAQIDHWLLDEFQDTSFGQWSVLQNLIDEAVQDPSGRRSFFYVGDVKQAIFTWREGDPRLFAEICARYNAARPGAISEERLERSWRSGPALIETVNRVFGDSAAIAALFPAAASAAWGREWRPHVSSRPERNGQVALLHAADSDECFAVALRVLQEIDPLERGLTCALLVQRNSTAARLADYLRREGGFPAVADSDLNVCIDNPVTMALLALLKAAAHPGDTLARGHVQMSPLGELLAADGLGTPEALTRRLLGAIHADGFERTLAALAVRIEGLLRPDDTFNRMRLEQLLAAAAGFDALGSREVAEFLQYAEDHVCRPAGNAGVIQILTIHKSKGLDYDVVLLPELEGDSLDCRREGLAVQQDAARSVDWILDLPSSLLCEYDPILAAHVEEARAEACYEKLSLLYVAMTRARRAMYLITHPAGKSASRNYPKLLADTLGESPRQVAVGALTLPGSWSAGDPHWHASIPPPAAPAAPSAPAVLDPASVRRSRRLATRRPSADRPGRLVPARQLFSLEGNRSAAFGTSAHALFAEVEWLEPGDVAAFATKWRDRGPAAAEVLACLAAPGLTEVWTRTSHSQVWRERSFELVVDNTWVSGVFDRVIVERDDNGVVVRATLYDFKTDRVEAGAAAAAAKLHWPQLEIYRAALSRLTGLQKDEIRTSVLFTGIAELFEMPKGGAGGP